MSGWASFSWSDVSEPDPWVVLRCRLCAYGILQTNYGLTSNCNTSDKKLKYSHTNSHDDSNQDKGLVVIYHIFAVLAVGPNHLLEWAGLEHETWLQD